MGYLDALASRVGRATLRSVSVCVGLATESGHLFRCLPPVALEVGESIAHCAERGCAEARVYAVPRACVGVRSHPSLVVSGPGDLLRQDIQLAVWAIPQGHIEALSVSAIDSWVEAAMLAFGASGRPVFDSPTAVHVPGSYSQDTYWRGLRRAVGHDPLVMPAVAALILDDRSQLVLVRTRTWDRWMIPGGSVELGESIADTAVRKAREETGYVIEPGGLLGAYAGKPFFTRYPNGDVTQHVSTPMVCHIVGGSRRPQVDEILDVQAFSVDALPSMFPQWEAIARDAFRGKLGRIG